MAVSPSLIKSSNVLASLAFADILVGIVVVPFSLTQVGVAFYILKFNNNLLVVRKCWDSGFSVITGARYEDSFVMF